MRADLRGRGWLVRLKRGRVMGFVWLILFYVCAAVAAAIWFLLPLALLSQMRREVLEDERRLRERLHKVDK